MEKLKSLGFGVLGFLLIFAVAAVAGLFIRGVSWVSEHLLPWFSLASSIAFLIELVVLLPLSALRKTRSLAALTIMYVSFLFGATVWMEGLITTEVLWGTWAVIVGLCFAGVGIVPIGMLAALFHAEWHRLMELLLLLALTFASRWYALWLGEKADREQVLHNLLANG